ncbi:MAG: type IV pilus twitching motility protein PilT [Planctomycetota bacterium]
MAPQIQDLLQDMVAKGASDMIIKAGSAPGFRIDGEVQPQLKYGVLVPDDTAALARQLMTDDQHERFEQHHDLDFSHAVTDLARFRVNTLQQRGSVGIVMRQIPDRIPTADQLGLPKISLDLAGKPRGLVLVTGPTGSGKSTTLAAMIDYVNETHKGHILTMEDPLEFVHPDKQCYVTQRQIGQDCASFQEALRRALRQDPDVILIGEMRDLETISMAITAAETGHLVFGTLHTTSAISTVDRIIDVFPTDAQQQVRVQLSSTLQGVISQVLLAKNGGGRVAAREVLVATDGVRSLIREGKTSQMLNLLQTGKAHGMCSLENELIELAQQGVVSADQAIAKANRPDEVRRTLERLGGAGAAAGNGAGNGASGIGSRSTGDRRSAPPRPAARQAESTPTRSRLRLGRR